jgi:serine/threonine protein kinase
MADDDWSERREKVDRTQSTQCDPGLLDLLRTMRGRLVGARYLLVEVLAHGGQGVLYAAQDRRSEGRRVVVKFAALPYHRPAYVTGADIEAARRQVEQESKVLCTFAGSLFPEWLDLVYDHNPLQPPARGQVIASMEPYLVMQLLEGTRLDEWARAQHRALGPAVRSQMAVDSLRLAHGLTELFNRLWTDGLVYSDLGPHNILVSREQSRRFRLLDAGSVIPDQPAPPFRVPYTDAFAPGDFVAAQDRPGRVWPDQAFVLHTLGKVLYQMLTNREVLPGRPLQFGATDWPGYPDELRVFVRSLTEDGMGSLAECADATRSVAGALGVRL